MQSEKEKIAREVYSKLKPHPWCLVLEEYKEQIFGIADYILQEKQKSYNQGVIDTVDKILNYGLQMVTNCSDRQALLEIEKALKIIKQSAEKSLGEK